jgi:hypothetical protein
MKRTLFFLFFVATTTTIFAVVKPSKPPVRQNNCSDLGFAIYGSAIFLQPNGSNLYWAVQAHPFDESIATPIVSPNWFEYEISPDYHPGFDVGVELLFKSIDVNLTAEWERLYGTDTAHQSVTPTATNPMIGPIFDIGPNSALYKQGKSKAHFNFDQVNLVLGKRVRFGNMLVTNIYAGAAFARIHQSLSSLYENPATNIARQITNPSTFTGAGTRFGVDFDFRIVRNFFFTGSSFISLMMGQLQNNIVYKSWSPVLAALSDPNPNVQRTNVPNRSQLVPGFEEKLGFAYDFPFHCGKVALGVGYQFQIYLNAIQSFDMISQVLPAIFPYTPDVGLFAVAYQRTLSNFILSGPYINLEVQF